MDIASPTALLGGLSPAQFMRRHWQKKPLLVRQALPGIVPPATRAELARLAASEDVEARLVSAFDGRWAMRHGPIAKLPPFSKPGWTLLVQGLDLHLQSAHELLSRFRFVPEARLDDLMISYASDGGGVGPHFDSYDVFLIQVAGKRRWRIGAQKDAVLREDVPLKIIANFEPEQEFVLEPGDMLYLPPGWAHDGVAVGGDCMTCSVGFRAPWRAELASELLPRLLDDESRPQANRMYADPREPATLTPGLVPAALLAFARDAAERALREPLALERALGEALTEPKPKVFFEPGEPLAAGQGVMLDRRSRMMYDAAHVFINGESFRASGRDARLMRAFADARRLSAAEVAKLTAGCSRRSSGVWTRASSPAARPLCRPCSRTAVLESLRQWALPHRQLRLLAAGYDELRRLHPRFVDWRRTWDHVVRAGEYQAGDVGSGRPEGLLLAPGLFSLRLLERENWRAAISVRAADEVAAREWFDAVWQRSSESFAASTLGLTRMKKSILLASLLAAVALAACGKKEEAAAPAPVAAPAPAASEAASAPVEASAPAAADAASDAASNRQLVSEWILRSEILPIQAQRLVGHRDVLGVRVQDRGEGGACQVGSVVAFAQVRGRHPLQARMQTGGQDGGRRLVGQVAVAAQDAPFQCGRVAAAAQQGLVVVAFQQQGVAALQAAQHLGRRAADIGQDAQAALAVAAQQLQRLLGIVGHGKGLQAQIAHRPVSKPSALERREIVRQVLGAEAGAGQAAQQLALAEAAIHQHATAAARGRRRPGPVGPLVSAQIVHQQAEDALGDLVGLLLALVVLHRDRAALALRLDRDAVAVGGDRLLALEQSLEEVGLLLADLLGIGIAQEEQALAAVAVFDGEAVAVQCLADTAPGALEAVGDFQGVWHLAEGARAGIALRHAAFTSSSLPPSLTRMRDSISASIGLVALGRGVDLLRAIVADEDVAAAVLGALDTQPVHITLAAGVQAVEHAAQRAADEVLRQLVAVFHPVGFHRADGGLVLDQRHVALLPELAQLRPHLLDRRRGVQPAHVAVALQLDAAGILQGHGAGAGAQRSDAGRRRCRGGCRGAVGRGLLQGRGADDAALHLAAVVGGQLGQVRRHVQALGLARAAAVVHLVGVPPIFDGAAGGQRGHQYHAGQAHGRGLQGPAQSRPASCRACRTLACPAAVSGVMGRRSALLQRPRRSSAHLVGAGLGSQKSCLCRPSSWKWMRLASRASPASAALQSSRIRRGATLAVTLTLPWPPSSIRATAVPSSPE
ncbi:unnamed protein product [Victoria cruziana]